MLFELNQPVAGCCSVTGLCVGRTTFYMLPLGSTIRKHCMHFHCWKANTRLYYCNRSTVSVSATFRAEWQFSCTVIKVLQENIATVKNY